MPGRQAPRTVSVLVPTFNRARFLGEAIESILGQSLPPFEIIVLDDGSTDETADICSTYRQSVRYVRIPQNAGKTAAINLGLTLARGAFVWVMDDDDIAPPDALEALLAPFQVDSGLGFTFGSLKKFTVNDRGHLEFEKRPRPAPPGPRHLFAHLMEDCFITGQPCTLFRKRCLDEIAPFDLSIIASVDYNILLQVARRHRGADVGHVVLWQRQHAGLRGPEAARYRCQERVQRWRTFDKRLLIELLPDLSLDEFLDDAAPTRPLAPLEVRRALLQKAVIAARKELWDIATDSLTSALAAAPGSPIDDQDLETLTRLLGSRYGIDEFLGDAQIQKRIAAAAGRGHNGRAVRAAIASVLTYWVGRGIRKKDPISAGASLLALYRLAGFGGAAMLAFQAVLGEPLRASFQKPAGRQTTAQPPYLGENRSTNFPR
jgi:hypothetical protein